MLRPSALVSFLLFTFFAVASLTACGSDDDASSGVETFDPTGTYQGPSTIAELASGKSFTAPEDGTIALTTTAMTLGPACTVALTAKEPVAFRADTSGASNIKVLALIDAPTNGQMCTLQTAAGAATFTIVDGLVQIWRTNDDATVDIALAGTTAGGGTVSYNFTGYR